MILIWSSFPTNEPVNHEHEHSEPDLEWLLWQLRESRSRNSVQLHTLHATVPPKIKRFINRTDQKKGSYRSKRRCSVLPLDLCQWSQPLAQFFLMRTKYYASAWLMKTNIITSFSHQCWHARWKLASAILFAASIHSIRKPMYKLLKDSPCVWDKKAAP